MANNTHHKRNQETTEMYLETILLLEREKDGVHAVDIAKNLGFSKPTVSEYLKRLHHQGLLSVNTDRIEHFISDETFGALRNLALERGAIGAESNR